MYPNRRTRIGFHVNHLIESNPDARADESGDRMYRRREICAARSIPEALKLIDQRHVVEVLCLVQHVASGVDACKGAEVVDEVRLIEVAAGESDINPVDFPCIVNQLQNSLEAADSTESLRSESNLLAEALYERALAEADLLGYN